MATEIERKFLVRGDAWRKGAAAVRIEQGYLLVSDERTVRVRIRGDQGFLTIKGRQSGATRPEFEYPIPVEDARQLIDHLCIHPTICKIRHTQNWRGFTWEIDEFEKENTGLVVAEIELQHPDQPFPFPTWIGEEVTDDPRYLNSNLAIHPYKDWR